jgi:cytochrome c553
MLMPSSQSVFRWTLIPTAVAALALVAGCRQDMQNEPKMVPQRESTFFASGRSVRPQVLGTVARGQLDADTYLQTGLLNGQEQDKMPFPVTMEVLLRGQERYNIYCTPCHSRVGNGRGMIVERGYKPAGNFHEAYILDKPISHYFVVMSHGYGAMPDYAAQLSAKDRWAVAAYIRALQLSQKATVQDVPPGTNIQTLAEVSQQMGYSADFPQGWTLPQMTDVPSANDMKTAVQSAAHPQMKTAESRSKKSSSNQGIK